MIGVVAPPLRRAETLVISGACVAPLRLGGLRGKKSTPSVGWEVPVSFPWSASRGGTERGKRHSTRDVSKAGVWLRYDFTSVI
jgi:hypothetical protein